MIRCLLFVLGLACGSTATYCVMRPEALSEIRGLVDQATGNDPGVQPSTNVQAATVSHTVDESTDAPSEFDAGAGTLNGLLSAAKSLTTRMIAGGEASSGQETSPEIDPKIDDSSETDAVSEEVAEAPTAVPEPQFEFWPPKLDQRYPDLLLRDQNGRLIQLSRLAGKPILVELVAVPCKGCQSFAGAEQHGSFADVGFQRGLGSIHDYASRFGKVELGPDIAFVQLIVYGKNMKAPGQEEITGWAKHFGMDARRRQLVLGGTPEMIGPETYQLIPGFQLIDSDFVLRYDSSGHKPRHNLYTELLPAIGDLTR